MNENKSQNETMTQNKTETISSHKSNSEKFKTMFVFQFKLFLDALRDLVLSPLSITAALVDIAIKRDEKNSYFELLMALGRRSDQMINLFGEEKESDPHKLDDLRNQIQGVFNKANTSGKLSDKDRDSLEKSLNKMSNHKDDD